MGATPYETGDLNVFVEALVSDFQGMEAVDGLSRDAIQSVLIGLGVPNEMRGEYGKAQTVKVAVRLNAEFTIVKEFEVEVEGEVNNESIRDAVENLYLDADEIVRDEIWDTDLERCDWDVEDFTTDLSDSLI